MRPSHGGTPAPRSPLGLIALAVVPAAVAAAYAAAALAWRAGYHSALGAPLWLAEGSLVMGTRVGLAVAVACAVGLAVARRWNAATTLALAVVCAAPAGVGPVYSPAAGVRWTVQAARHGGDGSPDVQTAVLAGSFGGLVALALVAALTAPASLRPSGSHGTAAWGDADALQRAEHGLVLGRAARRGKRRARNQPAGPLLRYDGPGHVLTVAPTRAGKGVGAVVPNLLDHPGPVFVTDPKGENLALTALYRARALGHDVVALDPFGLAPRRLGLSEAVGGTGTIQLGALQPPRPRPDAALARTPSDDAAMIADMLVVSDGERWRGVGSGSDEAQGAP